MRWPVGGHSRGLGYVTDGPGEAMAALRTSHIQLKEEVDGYLTGAAARVESS